MGGYLLDHDTSRQKEANDRHEDNDRVPNLAVELVLLKLCDDEKSNEQANR